MQNLRRLVQIVSFALFVYLFVLTVGQVTEQGRLALVSAAPIDTFIRMDPLLGISSMVAARKLIEVLLWYGLPVVVLTVLAGRFFCGWICPLGTTLDAADTLFYRRRKRNEGRRQPYRNFKYYLLFAVLVTALFSAQVAYFFDPVVIITRAFTFTIAPPLQLAMRSIGSAGSVAEIAPFLLTNRFVYDHQFFYRMNLVFFLIFAGIIAADALSRRFWCRTLCPLGAMLALISKVSLVKRLVGNTCRDCSRCARECKMAAICDDPKDYIAPECIYCYSCTRACATSSTRIVPAFSSPHYHTELDLTRRRTVQALGIGVAWAALSRTDWTAKTARESKIKISSPQLIRPPGALPEQEFLARCIRCSECMKVCPTNGLQPALAEAGIEGFWSPVLVPRVGECVQNCNLCSKVCSTQAIQPVEIEEKPYIFIGTAVIDRSSCIVWNQDKPCLVCDEYCSYHAVNWKVVDGVRRPFVDEKKCTGCGICENACPIQPQSAIRVFSFGDKRHMSRGEQRRWGGG
jgi:polyferredoxin/formate hydrogenlyase subunit 6/NADH:ubiquinone oxidoreductase subunit I